MAAFSFLQVYRRKRRNGCTGAILHATSGTRKVPVVVPDLNHIATKLDKTK